MRLHPARRELLLYAEGLADGGKSICARTARHVMNCPQCREQVERMRTSLVFVAEAPELSPSEELTVQILAAARSERGKKQPIRRGLRAAVGLAKGLACAAGIVIMAAVSFQSALESKGQSVGMERPSSALRSAVVARSTEEIRKASSSIKQLAAALDVPSATPRSRKEWQHRRTALALSSDLTAALSAIERNPGCVRAVRLVNANIQRQADALKTLYVERTL